MVIVFWHSQGVIYIDYLEKGKTIMKLYYAEPLVRFDVEFQGGKKPAFAFETRVLFHHDNATVYTSAVATEPRKLHVVQKFKSIGEIVAYVADLKKTYFQTS